MSDWTPQIALLLPLLSAVVAWYINERSKRAWEEYTRKEQHYTALILALRGFYTSTASKDLRDEFLQQLNVCWLYCPDDVIMKAYAFLDSVHEGAAFDHSQSERALGELVSAIRNDMLSRGIVRSTRLDGSTFRRFASR